MDKFSRIFATVWRLIIIGKQFWLVFVIILCVNAVYSLVYQGRVYLVKDLMDRGIEQADFDYCVKLAIIAAVLAVVLAVFRYLKEYLEAYLSLAIIVRLRKLLFKHIITLPMRFFNKEKSGEVMSRMTNDVAVAHSAMHFAFGDLIEQPLKIASGFVVAFYINWQITLGALVLFPVFVIPLTHLGKLVRKYKKMTLEKLGDLTEAMHQMFTGIKIIKAFDRGDYESERFDKLNQSFMRKSLKVERIKALTGSMMELFQAVALAFVFIGGGYLVIKSKSVPMSKGDFLALVAAVVAIYAPSRVLSKAYNNLLESTAGCDRIFEFLDIKTDIVDAPDAKVLGPISKGVSIKNVTFKYETELVIRNLSLDVKHGEMIALVGPSGAGKTTLLDLVARFYDPMEGSIEIDGIDLRNITNESYKKRIAVVTQDPFLFNATIRENIGYGRENATDSELEAVAKAANIHEYIAGLEKCFDSEVGERGAMMSGGQRQRIAIARAILKNPDILLLDEATSALDAESEKLVQGALANLMKGRTTFVIAHRLSTVLHADKIVVIDKGEIVESGKHDALVSSGGLYSKLYKWQFEEAPVTKDKG